MSLAFALVPGFANLLENHDCPDYGKQEEDGLGWTMFDVHLLRLQFVQVLGMLPAGARLSAAAKDFLLISIAAAVDLAGRLVIAARAVAGTAGQGEDYGNGDQSSHGVQFSLKF